MSIGNRGIKRRRQVFGAVLLMVAVVLIVAAMSSRVRVLTYMALLLGGIGVWMISRRNQE